MLNDFDVTLAKKWYEGFRKIQEKTHDLCILDVNDAV
jgi:hypothetical protein